MPKIDETNYAIGQRIRQLREAYRYTQEQFAEKVGISPRYIGSIEHGNKTMTIKTLMSIASVLRVSADYLLYGSEMDTSPIDQALMKMGKDDRKTMKKLFLEAIRILDEIPKDDAKEDNEKSQP